MDKALVILLSVLTTFLFLLLCLLCCLLYVRRRLGTVNLDSEFAEDIQSEKTSILLSTSNNSSRKNPAWKS